MKPLFFIIISLFVGITVNAQKKGQIKDKKIISTTVWQYDDKNKGEKESFVRYDSKGNVIEEIEYKMGKISTRITYIYNDDNNKTEETYYDLSGKKTKIIRYKYDGDLKVERAIYDANGKLKKKKVYVYEFGE